MQSQNRYLFPLLSLIVMIGSSALHGQYLISAESLGIRSKAELQAQFGAQVRTGVSMYKILYMTVDVHGMTDTASGLLVFPEIPLADNHPVVIYQHGTTNGPSDAPSRLGSGSSEALAYGSMGYVTIAADYLGLGDNDGFHPYVHAESEASAALDFLFAATEWLENALGEAWIGNLFIAGYSQGGHGAAAIQKELEDNWGFVYPVTASTPMSGPYSLSGVMYERIISDEVYFSPAYIAYISLGYQEVYGNLYNELGDIFKPAYVPIIENFRDHLITTSTLNFNLINQIFMESLSVKPKLMFKDSVLQAIIANDQHPFRVALRDNDLYDWAPQAPTRLYYCTADEQVLYENALVADSVMRANGAPDVAAVNFGNLSHGGCAEPAIDASIAFFDSFILPSAIDDKRVFQPRDLFYPNPACQHLSVYNDITSDLTDVKIVDITGAIRMYVQKLSSSTLDVSNLPSGVYLLEASNLGERYFQKVIIRNQK